ncbi:MAG: hypothetical protein IPM94_12780 [bacterium]|nr:hypothetical protein [bacterium]
MPWLHERLRGDRRRWPLSGLAALALLWCGGQLAADLYPRGRLRPPPPSRRPISFLAVLPPLEVVPDETAARRRRPRRRPRAPPPRRASGTTW